MVSRQWLLFCTVFFLCITPAYSANVALFADTNFVGYNPGNSSDEASNLQATLESLGHSVATFTGTSTVAWSSALAGVDVLAIPEQEDSAIYPVLEAGARSAILSFVSSGGGLIINQDYEDFLNDLFGWSLTTSGTSPWNLVPANASGTAFAGGPASLPYNDDTSSYSGLPAGSICMYADASSNCVVLVVPYGSGFVVLLGWDWYDAQPTGSLDNGWVAVLGNSMQFVGGAGPAPSGATPIPTLDGLSLALLAFILGLVAFGYLRRGKVV